MKNSATKYIYEMVIIAINKTEIECSKYKEKIEDINIKKNLKCELSDLHEIRRTIERFDNFEINKGLK
ncbi:MAG: hypothetical protein IE890_09400 [Arcobacter sp.]|nr:hypothetical protein [Arcobacter sp.]